jgi:Lrp/AsnC family transcriptional regulator, leucine-responsive regulatory protein
MKREFVPDNRDRKILYELHQDARTTSSRIAKKLRLSQEVVNYRIKQLEKHNIITGYQLIVNLAKLGVFQFKICLSLQHTTSEKFKQIIGLLEKHKAVKWIAACKGNWDLIISLEADSLEAIDELKSEILELFGEHINRKAVSIMVESGVLDKTFLINNKPPLNQCRDTMKESKRIPVDKIDLLILQELSKNSRLPIVELAYRCNTTTRVAHARLRRLIKEQVITGSKVAINYQKLGILFYKLFLYLDKPKKQRIKQLIHYLQRHPNTVHYVKVLCNWDLEPELEVHSENELNDILTEIKDNFSDIVKTMDVITISKEYKFVYF